MAHVPEPGNTDFCVFLSKNKTQGQVVQFKYILDFITQSSNLLNTVSFFICPFAAPFSVSSPATSLEDQKSGLQINPPPFISLSVKSCVDRGMCSLFVYIWMGAQISFHSSLISIFKAFMQAQHQHSLILYRFLFVHIMKISTPCRTATLISSYILFLAFSGWQVLIFRNRTGLYFRKRTSRILLAIKTTNSKYIVTI